jgi:ribulose-5-phosphate 4-epimerase/fuculose-1-phosphate aldolase
VSSTDLSRAARVAEALGQRRAALLRNHGVVIAGEDVRWTVLTALALERAIRFQVIAASLGRPRSIATADAELLRPQKYRDAFMDDYWAAWERRVDRARMERPVPER